MTFKRTINIAKDVIYPWCYASVIQERPKRYRMLIIPPPLIGISHIFLKIEGVWVVDE